MKLICLGTTGFLPTDTAQTACYLLPELGIMLDAGSGLYRLPAYLQTPELDIYITHAHGDHHSGMTYLFASYFKSDVLQRGQPLDDGNINDYVRRANQALARTRIHADDETLSVLKQKHAGIPYDWRTLQRQEKLPQNGAITSFLMEGGTYGFRLDWPGHSMAYITDTIARPGSSYIDEIEGVDLLLHECNGPDHLAALTEKIGHSHTSTAAQVAASAHVKRLALVHDSPIDWLDYGMDLEHARQVFPDITIAHDGMEFDF
jgi:ribonuclease Z